MRKIMEQINWAHPWIKKDDGVTGDLPPCSKAESFPICPPEKKIKKSDDHVLVLLASVQEQQNLPISAR